MDSLGNVSAKKERTVKVEDTTRPDDHAQRGYDGDHMRRGSIYKDSGASAVDVVDGDLSSEVEVVSTVDSEQGPGSYSVTYSVSDAATGMRRLRW